MCRCELRYLAASLLTREAGLRLDLRESATTELDSGDIAVVPGELRRSELWTRIIINDDSLRMPPAESGKGLSKMETMLPVTWDWFRPSNNRPTPVCMAPLRNEGILTPAGC